MASGGHTVIVEERLEDQETKTTLPKITNRSVQLLSTPAYLLGMVYSSLQFPPSLFIYQSQLFCLIA
jgi:hypothetical protein